MMSARMGFALLVGAVACSTHPVAAAPQTFDRAAVDAVFADLTESPVPGCALGVVRDGELVYGRGYGMANLEHEIPITTKSVFRIASVSKQFTGAVVAIAAMEGHLSLEDPLRKWIPELPDYGQPLTIRHALNHTSGLRDYITLMRLRGLRGDDFYTGEELISVQVRQEELNFPSGSEYLYSNSGYFLLAEAVKQGAKSWLQTVRDPEAIVVCLEAGIGSTVTLEIGGKTDSLHGDRVRMTGRITRISDGRFEDTGPVHAGWRFFDGGTTIVLETEEGPTVALVTTRVGNMSREQFYSLGYRPEEFDIMVAKGVVSPRPAYQPIASEMISVNTPGITSGDMSTFEYMHVRKSLYPLDRDAKYGLL